MLVYREQRRMARPADLLLESRRQLLALAPGHQGARDRVLRVLIDVGVLEAAIADEACPDVETLAPGLAVWRHASVLAGHLAWHSRRGDSEAMRRWAVQLDQALGRLADLPLPEHLVTRVPEGFAQYGLDPMGYAGAAEELTRTLQPGRATCVGIRLWLSFVRGLKGRSRTQNSEPVVRHRRSLVCARLG